MAVNFMQAKCARGYTGECD